MTYELNPDVLVTDLQDELALLDPRTSQVYTLNAVGRAVWQALNGGDATEDELLLVITQAFDVATSQARADIRALLRDLEEEGLVRQRSGHATP